MDIFVKGLAESVTSSQLKELFSMYGKVLSSRIIVDHETQVSRGFGFVKMPIEPEAKLAMRRISGSELEGNILTAKVENPGNFNSPRDSILPRSFKPPKELSSRVAFKDYN
ncbi:RNA recognition motif domain-containing protein [Candidatus Neptunichlamydia sp. REUL1]|uniref:RNA recognition motif domain-containing protein n=1 Tax=Candidatus Neptunichlamydia sp. REUL1 TaxID=3064277 RepID=UPI00292D92BD|nr:RNA-binding protein [Candidatus Neptunochlamydia sp. REUL1]